MKYCNNCNTEFRDDVSFCTNCGSELKSVKPKKKGAKIFKRILLAVVAVIAIGFGLYTHLLNSTTYLVLNSQGEIFAKAGGSKSISIDYDGYAWEITYEPTWVDVVSGVGNSFTIYCEQNTTGEDRNDHITIKSGKIIQALPIGQYGKAQYLRLSETAVSSDKDGGSIYIDIETDGCDVSMEYPKFCEIENFTTEGFTLKVKPNSGNTRSGSVQVKEDNLTKSLYVKQEGTCPDCNGSGYRTCSMCNGSGSYYGWGMYSTSCYSCGGTGFFNCHACGGDGYR